jgi:deoxyribodipyrimidine photo-lyase
VKFLKCHRHKAQKVLQKVAYEEKQTEKAVQETLFKMRCELETLSTITMYHAEDTFAIKYSDVFYEV